MKKQGQFILLNVTEFAEWLRALKVNRQIKLIQEHHTWLPSYKQFKGNNHFEMVQSMKESHSSRGFSDIAQNITTYPDGLIMICRPFSTAPAGIKGANSYGICIENVGNFDKGNDSMIDKQKNTIITMTALLCKKFNLTPSTETIVYHNWYDLDTGKRTNGKGNVKSCPGDNFFGGNTVEACNKYFIPLVKNGLVSPTLSQNNNINEIKFHKSCVVNCDKLNCRKSPIDGQILKTFKFGDKLTIVDYNTDKTWGKLVSKNFIGWVCLKYVKML